MNSSDTDSLKPTFSFLHFISTAFILYNDLFLVCEHLPKIPQTKLELLGNDYLIGANGELEIISTPAVNQ